MTDTLTVPATDRRLATIETITEIASIPDADAIVRARVRGWDVVIKKGEFHIGDMVVYVEVDSFLDVTDPRFEFLAVRGVRRDETGAEGNVVKTARLRGQYSQGIAFPLSAFPELVGAAVGDDVTGTLRVTKWDPPLSADLAGTARGLFPSWIRKTDEERVQNTDGILDATDGEWIATEKIDGTSMTVWVTEDDYGVSSRNLDITENPDNSMWAAAGTLSLHDQLRAVFPGRRAVVQGELYGPGIQKNPLMVKRVTFAAFTVYVDGRELPRPEWPAFVTGLAVPVYDFAYPATVDEALAQVDGLKSLISPDRNAEGVVWRNTKAAQVLVRDRFVRASWKCISNKYAMKHDA